MGNYILLKRFKSNNFFRWEFKEVDLGLKVRILIFLFNRPPYVQITQSSHRNQTLAYFHHHRHHCSPYWLHWCYLHFQNLKLFSKNKNGRQSFFFFCISNNNRKIPWTCCNVPAMSITTIPPASIMLQAVSFHWLLLCCCCCCCLSRLMLAQGLSSSWQTFVTFPTPRDGKPQFSF